MKRSGANVLTLYSCELKRELNFVNLREDFFKPYRIHREQMSVIWLLQKQIERYFSTKHKTELNWDSINKLSETNPDFRKFLADVGAALQTSRIYEKEFDTVFKNADELKKTPA